MEPSALSEAPAAAPHSDYSEQQHRSRRRRRRRHGEGEHQELSQDEDGGDGGAFWSDEDGDEGGENHNHGQQPPPASPPPPPLSPAAPQPSSSGCAPSSPLRPLQIDSPNLRQARESASPLTPGRSPSRRRQERRLKAAAVKAGRMRKRLLVTVFLLGALVGSYFVPRLFPKYYADWMIPLSAFNVSSVIPAAIADVNSTILNDVWGIFQAAVSPETYPGLEARDRGLKAHFPIVLVPGFITTGLEVWEGEECASSLFRSRLWGAFTMLSTMLRQPECWAKHMALDMATGLDPPGIRIRPAQGLEAADNFLGSFFWVWSRLIRDFAAVGYDHSNMILASYDWRLSLHDMERRDHYFTILKARIETLVKISGGRKVVLIAHSYGSNVMVYFMKWVEAKGGGNGGSKWCDHHIHAFVNVAGPLLGVIKAASSYVSGEMRDTSQMGELESILFGNEGSAFNRRNRRRLFRTWGSLTAMLPKGGAAVWGNLTHAPDDVEEEAPWGGGSCLPVAEDGAFVAPPGPGEAPRPMEGEEAPGELPGPTADGARDADSGGGGSCVTPGERRAELIRYGQVISFAPAAEGEAVTSSSSPSSPSTKEGWTVEDVIRHLQGDPDDPHLRRRLTEDYDFGYVADPRKLSSRAQEDKRLWTNPLAVALPKAPKMKILCYYGVGKPTERAYIYKTAGEDGAIDVIDAAINDPRRNISDGVLMGEGDGTVSLLSLGYHCAKLWREPTHNPSGASVTSRELWHTTTGLLTLTRTGGASGDHVDVLGNTEMASELLRLVSGDDEGLVEVDRYYSRIEEMADRITLR